MHTYPAVTDKLLEAISLNAADTISLNISQQFHTSGVTASDTALEKVSKWLNDCENGHPLCAAVRNELFVPNRILEIVGTHVHLREQPTHPVRYACLSHCWGPIGPALRLQQETMVILKGGVATDDLPRTFKDAVDVCLRLNIQYLWIDALCTWTTKLLSGQG